MCIRDRLGAVEEPQLTGHGAGVEEVGADGDHQVDIARLDPVSYTHLRAHETVLDLVCRLLLEKKKTAKTKCTV